MKYNINYAPPLDIPSFQLTVTEGCSHNKCIFCNMFSDIEFRVIPIDEIERDLQQASAHNPYIDRVFLESGDAFVLSAQQLIKIAGLIHHYLPKVEVIASYASIKNIMSKTDEELNALAKEGFGEINIGLESGLDDVLAFMNKGFHIAQVKEQLIRLRHAKISFSINIIGGSAGSTRIIENAIASANICNEVQPSLIYVSPLQVDRGSRIESMIASGDFKKLNLGEYIMEEIEFLKYLKLDNCGYYAAHMLNPVSLLGTLPYDKERMLSELQKGMNKYREMGMLSYQLNC